MIGQIFSIRSMLVWILSLSIFLCSFLNGSSFDDVSDLVDPYYIESSSIHLLEKLSIEDDGSPGSNTNFIMSHSMNESNPVSDKTCKIEFAIALMSHFPYFKPRERTVLRKCHLTLKFCWQSKGSL